VRSLAPGLKLPTLAGARLYAERAALSLGYRTDARQNGRILCYHSVGTPAWGINDVSPRRFRAHLEMALREGYHFVTARSIALTGGRPRDLAVTFDDGLASVATNAAPVLRELGIPWSLFVVSDWAAGRHRFGDGVMLGWSEIARLAEEGVEIGSHSVTHPDFGRLESASAEAELTRSRAAIAEHIGSAPTSFAIPLGGSRNWTVGAQTAALAAGYDVVLSQSEERRPAGTVGRSFITRFDGARFFRAALVGAFDRWEERL